MARSFSATISHTDHSSVVTLVGELDMGAAPELAPVLDPLIDGGPKQVVLDCSQLSFIDSSGISALIALQRRLSAQQRHFVVRSPRPFVMKVMELTGLVEFLHIDEKLNGTSSPNTA